MKTAISRAAAITIASTAATQAQAHSGPHGFESLQSMIFHLLHSPFHLAVLSVSAVVGSAGLAVYRARQKR